MLSGAHLNARSPDLNARSPDLNARSPDLNARSSNLSARLDCGAITDVGDFVLKDGSLEATIPALGASYQNTSTLVSQGTKLLVVRPKSFEPKLY